MHQYSCKMTGRAMIYHKNCHEFNNEHLSFIHLEFSLTFINQISKKIAQVKTKLSLILRMIFQKYTSSQQYSCEMTGLYLLSHK